MALTKLQKKIMRRVYYAYAIRVATLPGVPQGFLVLGALIALTYFISLGDVINNLMHIEVGDVGHFVYSALTRTEVWSLFLIGIIVFSLLSLRFKVSPPRMSYYVKA